MKIISNAFEHNSMIPPKYTCDGQNINPSLEISGAPENTKSLVLIVDDPDAPMGTWIHWTIWNIEPKTNVIAENSCPGGAVEGMTSFGRTGYGGPCPPSGTHRYFFKIFALDSILDLTSNAYIRELEHAMQNHIIDHAEVIGLYKRSSQL
ncbi:MAG: YbhB/YbcL family Raf kinase inhibitor-like protein [Actinobacteria bacterium]|nr:YbhB/YbcL family Raf kinase inhibitor-like protein [Actinomycetota bacterium]MBM3712430.1 YbhB/YbcL family Raf kinase inhibitor-like protein [Actinomycetota bacterium]